LLVVLYCSKQHKKTVATAAAGKLIEEEEENPWQAWQGVLQ
jgi:hypothetical protein